MMTARPSRRHRPCDGTKPTLSRENAACDGRDTGPGTRHTRPKSPLKPTAPTQRPTLSQPVPDPPGTRPPGTGGRDGLTGPQARDTTIRDGGTGPPRTRPAVPNPSERTHRLAHTPNPTRRTTPQTTAIRNSGSANRATPNSTRTAEPTTDRTGDTLDPPDSNGTGDSPEGNPLSRRQQSPPVPDAQRAVQQATTPGRAKTAGRQLGTANADLRTAGSTPELDEAAWIREFLTMLGNKGFFDESKSRDIRAILE